MNEALIIVASSCAGAFIVWFFSKKEASTSGLAQPSDNSDEVVALKVKIAKLEQQIEDLETHKEEDAKRCDKNEEGHRPDSPAGACVLQLVQHG